MIIKTKAVGEPSLDSIKETRKQISHFLNDLISQGKLSLKDYFSSNPQINQGLIESTIVFLQLFNVVALKKVGNNVLIKSTSRLSLRFLESLAIYIEDHLPLISDWKNLQSSELVVEDIFSCGSNVLMSMEKRRSKELGSIKTLSNVEVTLLLIKANVDGYVVPQFLFQFNLKTNRFQLIGGYKNTDENQKNAIYRLLTKELPLNKITKNSYTAVQLIDPITFNGMARKTSVYTKYNFNYYYIKFKNPVLKLQPTDRWVSLVEMHNENSIDNIPILSPLGPITDEEKMNDLKNKIDELPLSFEKEQLKGPNEKIYINSTTHNDSDTLETLLKKDESENLEFKSSMRWDYATGNVNKILEKTIVRSISSFLNSNEGVLAIGLNDEKVILGIENDIQTLKKKNLDGYAQQIVGLVSSYLGSELSSFFKVTFEKRLNKTVCCIIVKRAPYPIFLKDGESRHFYIRSGNTSRELNPEETYKYIQLHW